MQQSLSDKRSRERHGRTNGSSLDTGSTAGQPTGCRITARLVDRLARQGFPLAFLLFNIIYWLVYTVSFSDSEEDL
jgi:hypothetical protein